MAEADLESPDPNQSASLLPWASLRYRDFSLFFVASLFVTTAQQMRLTQNFYQVYELSGSAFQLGLTGLAQAIPLFVVGLFGGTLADLMDRRKLLLLTISGNFLVAVSLGILTIGGTIDVWHILVSTALTSGLNIILNPARMAMISGLVPRSHLTNAVSLNSSVSQSSHFIGPMLAGLALAWMNAGNAYLLNALSYLPAAIGVLLMRSPAESQRAKTSLSVKNVLAGLQFLWFQRVVFCLVLMDFTIIGVSYYRPLLPVFAKEILLVGALGLTNSLQAVMRQTAFHLLTPEHLRGRAFSVFNMFSQGANSVGAMEVGFAASLIGAPGALLLGSAIGLVLTLTVWTAWPGLRQFRTAA